MDAGVNLAKIVDVRYLRDAKGNIKNPESPSIHILFENKEKKRASIVVPTAKSSQWIIDTICTTLELTPSEDGKIDVSNIIGKKLYIIVANEYLLHNGIRRKDSTGEEMFYPIVLPKFFKEAPIVEEKDLIIERESI